MKRVAETPSVASRVADMGLGEENPPSEHAATLRSSHCHDTFGRKGTDTGRKTAKRRISKLLESKIFEEPLSLWSTQDHRSRDGEKI